MPEERNALVRGFTNGLVRCPKHGALYLWTAITDDVRGGDGELELVKYDCGCIVSWKSRVIGATPTFEHEGRPAD